MLRQAFLVAAALACAAQAIALPDTSTKPLNVDQLPSSCEARAAPWYKTRGANGWDIRIHDRSTPTEPELGQTLMANLDACGANTDGPGGDTISGQDGKRGYSVRFDLKPKPGNDVFSVLACVENVILETEGQVVKCSIN